MNNKQKIAFGFGSVLLAVLISLISFVYSNKFSASGATALEQKNYSFNSANVQSVNNLNYYIPKGKLSGLSFYPSPPSSPNQTCTGTATIPTKVNITDRGWPIRYAYEVPPIFCSSGNYWTYLPVAFALNTLIYIVIIILIFFVRNKFSTKKPGK